ncbi:MAG TPA: hypothetical protein VGJ20_11295 [Xanthobacteraceae bacterium]|jgi:hypothetical protein
MARKKKAKRRSSKKQRNKFDVELLYISLKGFSWFDRKRYPNEGAAEDAFDDPQALPQGVVTLAFEDSDKEIAECFFFSPSLTLTKEEDEKDAIRTCIDAPYELRVLC